MAAKALDLTGVRSGMLIAIRIAGKTGTKNLWECLCDCGQLTTTVASNIKNGSKTSCGCKKKQPRKPRPDLVSRNKSNATHGRIGARVYNSWQAMKYRCQTETSKDYPNYGGRGIKVCEEWSASFEAFLSDMGERPSGMSLDRIDHNGNYEPSNCRWASDKKQSNNRRVNLYVEFGGKTQTATEWARDYGLESKTLIYRIKAGWEIERALTTPSTIKRK